jgi:hypothetical protein
VKIKGTCKRDGRDFLAEQVVAAGGQCPWDGEPFNADYAVTLVNALREAEAAGSRLELALEQIAALRPDLTLHADSVIGGIQIQLSKLGRNLVQQG